MNFDEIRPYRDEEVAEKIQALIEEPQFEMAMKQANPELPFRLLAAQMSRIKTIKEFQSKIIVPLIQKLLSQSTDGLSAKGLENLDPKQRYVFVSTHRDIALDSALMNAELLQNGHETTEIAIGDNLMKIPWVVDLVKLNKTFIVKRNLPKEERQQGSLQLSSYIHYAIKEKNESVWIAQKAGRSKDGNDRTNPSILKMFSLAGGEDIIKGLRSLNICPVSIAYEYNPCDYMSLPELMAQEKGERYEKQAMEDMIQMAEGITGYKGKVQVSFGQPLKIDEEWRSLTKTPNELFSGLAKKIDELIHNSYSLMKTNYMAHDLLHDSERFKDQYSFDELTAFKTYVSERCAKVEGDEEVKKKVFLKMYANPVINKLEVD